MPLNVLFVEDELKYHLDDCDAKALIVWDAFLAQTLPAAESVETKYIFVCYAPDSEVKLLSKVQI
ncbi:MAG: long-chain fatty acid--CoA ligase [Gammaproteobacteria bacterium]|nr:long-chain fatty acid--CoA ligase [Gammaproteobacteria bacterium]